MSHIDDVTLMMYVDNELQPAEMEKYSPSL